MNKDLTRISKYLSKLLRHDPEELEISNDGYIKVSKILKKLNITQDELDHIVEENNKKRFEYKGHKEYIKARQGHSNEDVNELQLEEVTTNVDIYHGTASNLNASILAHGLKKMSRQHVHFTPNLELAKSRAKHQANKNHSRDVVYKLNVEQWLKDGNKLYKSGNDVYLTDDVPFKYLSVSFKIRVDGKTDESALNELIEKYKTKV